MLQDVLDNVRVWKSAVYFSLLSSCQIYFALGMALLPVGSTDQPNRPPVCEPPQSTSTLGKESLLSSTFLASLKLLLGVVLDGCISICYSLWPVAFKKTRNEANPTHQKCLMHRSVHALPGAISGTESLVSVAVRLLVLGKNDA